MGISTAGAFLTKTIIYFDVTDIVNYAATRNRVTGIQRVLLGILDSVVRKGDREVFGILRLPLTGRLEVADLSFMHGQYGLGDFSSRFGLSSEKKRWMSRKLRRYWKPSFSRFLRRYTLEIQWYLSKGFRVEAGELLDQRTLSCLIEQRVEPDSVVISLGAGWETDYTGVEQFARLQNCKVAAFIHDIFAITDPQCTGFNEEKLTRFRVWLDYIIQNYDLLVCSSSFVKDQLETYAKSKALKPKIEVLNLAHEFALPRENNQAKIREMVTDLAGCKYALCVGTIEIRKNIMPLLRVWDELRQVVDIKLPKLVLAGGKGWKVDDVYDFLKETSNVGGTVLVVSRPSDAELMFLYEHCAFTIFPSLLEGWGLPVGESLWFGKPVICANNASMPEVGNGLATYFDHRQTQSLFAAIKGMIEHPLALPENIRDYLTTWNDTATSLCCALDAISREPPRQTELVSAR